MLEVPTCVPMVGSPRWWWCWGGGGGGVAPLPCRPTLRRSPMITNGVFTPERDNDKTTTRQMLNLCIPMMPFTPGPTCLV